MSACTRGPSYGPGCGEPVLACLGAVEADYERLREAVVRTGRCPEDLLSARFGRRGLASLIAWPVVDPVFWADLVGAPRPARTPYADPRCAALAGTYRLLVERADRGVCEWRQDDLISRGGRR